MVTVAEMLYFEQMPARLCIEKKQRFYKYVTETISVLALTGQHVLWNSYMMQA